MNSCGRKNGLNLIKARFAKYWNCQNSFMLEYSVSDYHFILWNVKRIVMLLGKQNYIQRQKLLIWFQWIFILATVLERYLLKLMNYKWNQLHSRNSLLYASILVTTRMEVCCFIIEILDTFDFGNLKPVIHPFILLIQ